MTESLLTIQKMKNSGRLLYWPELQNFRIKLDSSVLRLKKMHVTIYMSIVVGRLHRNFGTASGATVPRNSGMWRRKMLVQEGNTKISGAGRNLAPLSTPYSCVPTKQHGNQTRQVPNWWVPIPDGLGLGHLVYTSTCLPLISSPSQ